MMRWLTCFLLLTLPAIAQAGEADIRAAFALALAQAPTPPQAPSVKLDCGCGLTGECVCGPHCACAARTSKVICDGEGCRLVTASPPVVVSGPMQIDRFVGQPVVQSAPFPSQVPQVISYTPTMTYSQPMQYVSSPQYLTPTFHIPQQATYSFPTTRTVGRVFGGGRCVGGRCR